VKVKLQRQHFIDFVVVVGSLDRLDACDSFSAITFDSETGSCVIARQSLSVPLRNNSPDRFGAGSPQDPLIMSDSSSSDSHFFITINITSQHRLAITQQHSNFSKRFLITPQSDTRRERK